MKGSDFLKNWNDLSDGTQWAIVDKIGRYTFGDLSRKVESIAEVLLAGRTSLESARVGIFVTPGVDFVATFLGILIAGGAAVVLSPLHPAAESRYFCEDSCIEAVIVSKIWKNQVLEFAPEAQILEVELISSPKDRSSGRNFGSPGSPRSEGVLFHFVSNDAPALQLYTSGTTGKPKGAVLSHGNLAAQQDMLREAWGLKTSDVLLHTLPLHHMHGLCIALLSVLGAGGCVSFAYPFDPAEIWNKMQGSTVFMAVPTIYAKLLAHYESASPQLQKLWKENAKNLRLATSGSAALPVSLAEKWKTLTGDYPLERFGMTEVGVALSNPLLGMRKSGRVGLPLPSVEYKILNEAGQQSEVGELWISGPSVFKEYFRRSEATQSAFVEHDGIRFFRTGDTVTRDEDGYFKILGRNSVDILKSGGYKLSAIEIEEVFREHPAIAEVAVVGVPDEVWGDRVVACVVLKKVLGIPCSEGTLRDFARSQMASYKVPKQVLFLDNLPVNALGKVLKQDLLKQILKINSF